MNFAALYLFVFLSIFNGKHVRAQHPQKDSLSTYKPPKVLGLDSTYISTYPMVDFDKNYFQFFSANSPNWECLYEQMEDMVRTKKGSLNFYHIGGSHLQADIYTHDVRTMLQTNWNKLPGERGWVFPFKLAGTNNPWNYSFTSPNEWRGYRSVVRGHKTEEFGALGAKIVCPDSLIQIKFNYDRTDVKPHFNKIRIFHNKGFFPFELNWGNDEILWWRQHTNENLGYTEITFMENLNDFDLQFARKTSVPYDLEIYGFQLMNDDPGISYTAIGINGAGLYTYLDCERFEEQIKTYAPDFFAFSVGTNDANVPNGEFVPETYYNNLEKMMQIVLRANPNCAILLTVPNDALYRRRYLNYNVGKERDMIELLAVKYQVPVWDLYGMMGGIGSSRDWYRTGLMKSDYVHFTTEGYHLKGELYFDAFKKFLLQFGQRKLNYIRAQEDGGDQ